MISFTDAMTMKPLTARRILVNPEDHRQMREQTLALARSDFAFFVERAFRELYDREYHDNWHIHAIAHWLIRATTGDVRRLIIAMAPRSLKSFMASICLPAWILGHNPGAKIVCASYAQKLSEEFAFETRRLMQSDWYRSVFPNTHLDPKKSNTEVLATTRGGQRRATSVGGSLTGLGGSIVIIDDPIKAQDAHSEVARENAIKWYGSTVASRLDDPKKGRIIVIAQRLHLEDLPGQLLAAGGWELLELPLIEWKEREIEIAPNRTATRGPGHILHEDRVGEEEITRLRAEMGERDFEAQYNQRPLPPGGALFKLEWLRRFDQPLPPQKVQGTFQSWDTAYDIEDHHDYSVCTTWALSGKHCYLLDVYRERLEFYDLEKAIYRQREKFGADLVLVENVGSGKSVCQNIRGPDGLKNIWLRMFPPGSSKEHRASQQTPKFGRGEIHVPNEAPWLRAFEEEYVSFPHGKHDDQIDSMVQFLAAFDTGNLLFWANVARRR
jgi:predicted phage terminase large subunit-like protein